MSYSDKNIDKEKFVAEAEAVYEKIKSKYEPDLIGKFLAIDPKTEKVYLAETSLDALKIAKKENPHTGFFIKKIGFGAIGTLATYFPVKYFRKNG
ncbi:MAG: hypothetical protein K1X86_14225 [Ignavibacteria bacterium]|nr:hypothetical protein [Ignavibacteria bacterium]